MSFTLTGVITGGAQTGFTSPTYTLGADTNPANNGKQSVVTALGGTQTGVTAHSASDVFTLSVFKPLTYKVLNYVSSTVFRRPPRNTYKVIVRKSVTFLVGQPKDILVASTTVDVPAGADSADSANCRAAISLLSGFQSSQSSGFGDTIVTGILG